MPERLRLFVALELTQAVGEEIDSAIGPWREQLVGVRWAPRELRHVTLKFLGPTPVDTIGEVGSALENVGRTSGSIAVSLRGMGAFPSVTRARVLWVGVDDAEGELSQLAGAIDEGLGHLVGRERRPFHPHITIARCEKPQRLPAGYASTPVAPAAWRAGSLALMSSHPGARGPRYERMGSYRLAADPRRGTDR